MVVSDNAGMPYWLQFNDKSPFTNTSSIFNSLNQGLCAELQTYPKQHNLEWWMSNMNLTTPMESIKASQSMNNSITYERKESMSIFKSFKMNVNNYNSRKLFNLSRTTMNPMVQKIRLDKRITLLEKISFSRGTISISMLIQQ